MTNLLILTVGTGTAGRHSDLASGLRRTLELLNPRKFWLVPSTAPDSLAIADLIAEGHASYGGRFPLEHPDDLESSRQHIRSVIRQVRGQVKEGERLLVNPTSGTKQMTAAATLAALDEQIGDIVFTTGDRADGVVKTGTERITAFNPAGYFRERDLVLARDFFDAGDFYAAERILRPHNQTHAKEWATAYTCHHWRRFDYDRAKAYDKRLENRAPRDIVADILAWSDHALRHDDPDGSFCLTYKALEHAARLFLEEKTGIKPDGDGRYERAQIDGLRTSFVSEGKGRDMTLGLQNIVKILNDLGHPFGTNFSGKLKKYCDIRNEATHAIRPANTREARTFFSLAVDLVGIPPTPLPESLLSLMNETPDLGHRS